MVRVQRAQLYVDMLTQARAQQFYLSFITSSDPAREGMREVFAEEDTRLPPLERAPAWRQGLRVRQPARARVMRTVVCRGVAGGGESRAVPLG